jgi:hypothetical protein
MFALVFGIPLSFASLLTGLTLGLGTKWGVFRKLLLIVSVILVGAFVVGPAVDEAGPGRGGAGGRFIAGAAYDVVALTVATALGVHKPGRRRGRPTRAAVASS